MKKIFYYAVMALAVSAVMVSCEKKEGETPQPPKKVRLETPEVTATVNTDAGTVTVSWYQIEGAVSYTYKVDDGTESSTDKLTVELNAADLQAGSHTVSVKAIPAEDSEEYNESNWGDASFTLEQQEVEMPEEYEPYVGTWSMATTHVFNWTEDPANPGYVLANFEERELVFPVTIAWDGVNQVLVVTGLSPLDALLGPLPAVLAKFDDGNMYICGMVTLNYDLGQLSSQLSGYKLTWLGVADLGAEGYSPLTSSQVSRLYQIVNNGDTMTGTGLEVEVGMQDGSTMNAEYVAIDLLALSGNSMTILTAETDYMPGGTFTFTKTGNSVPAGANINVINSILTNNFVASMAFPIATINR